MKDFEETLRNNKYKLQDTEFAIKVYRALCNTRWIDKDNPHNVFSCSWRYAGALIADIRDKDESYMDFYCSGNEGVIDPEVLEFFDSLGFFPQPI
jgi:hypothetical protein